MATATVDATLTSGCWSGVQRRPYAWARELKDVQLEAQRLARERDLAERERNLEQQLNRIKVEMGGSFVGVGPGGDMSSMSPGAGGMVMLPGVVSQGTGQGGNDSFTFEPPPHLLTHYPPHLLTHSPKYFGPSPEIEWNLTQRAGDPAPHIGDMHACALLRALIHSDCTLVGQ
jgi:hypothetical protein